MCRATHSWQGSWDPRPPQPALAWPLLGSPDGVQLNTVSRGLTGFPLQRLLDELPEQLRALTALVPHGLLQPPQPCQVLALHLAVLGLEVGTLWGWGGGGDWSGHFGQAWLAPKA